MSYGENGEIKQGMKLSDYSDDLVALSKYNCGMNVFKQRSTLNQTNRTN